MSQKIKLNDSSWFDWERWQAERDWMRKRELEYWEWVKTQPHLNSEFSELIGDIRTLQIEKELDDDSSRTDD